MYAFKRTRREPLPKPRPELTLAVAPPAQTFPEDSQPPAYDPAFTRPVRVEPEAASTRPRLDVPIIEPEGMPPAPPVSWDETVLTRPRQTEGSLPAALTRPRLVMGDKPADFASLGSGDALANLTFARHKLEDAGAEAPRSFLRRLAEGALRGVGNADPREGVAGMIGRAIGGGGASAAMPAALDNIHRREDLAGINTQYATELARRTSEAELARVNAQTGEITGRPARDAARAAARLDELNTRLEHQTGLLNQRGQQDATRRRRQLEDAYVGSGSSPEEARIQATAQVLREFEAGVFAREQAGELAATRREYIPRQIELGEGRLSETRRHNGVTEGQGAQRITETGRHNSVTEVFQGRNTTVNENNSTANGTRREGDRVMRLRREATDDIARYNRLLGDYQNATQRAGLSGADGARGQRERCFTDRARPTGDAHRYAISRSCRK
jgi:hypothetical protein